jgi:hypothetical protein
VPQGACAPEEVPAGCELVIVKTINEALDQLMDW